MFFGHKKGFTLLLVLLITGALLIGGLSGCGKKSEPAAEGTKSEETKSDSAQSQEGQAKGTFKVAALLPGPITDQGWNASAYEGLKLIEKELGAEISYMETKTPGDMVEGFRDYASKGYNLVIGHGFQYQDAAEEVAPQFPDTVFVTIGGSKTQKNQAPVIVKSEDASYIFGIIAAKMSKTGKAGLVGGFDIPAISKTLIQFEAGAKSVNPDFKCMVTYVGSWEDVTAGYEAAIAQIDQGADFLFCNGNAVGLGVIQAAQERGVYVFGMTTDQSNLAPDNVLASDVVYNDKAYLEIAKRVKEGKFEGKIQEVGMKDGVVEVVWNPKLKDKVPKEVLDTVADIEQKIKSGEFRVPGELEVNVKQ